MNELRSRVYGGISTETAGGTCAHVRNADGKGAFRKQNLDFGRRVAGSVKGQRDIMGQDVFTSV